MSISAMTNVAMARKQPPTAPPGASRGDMARTAAAARDGAAGASAMTQALDMLTAYIPTEVLTIYVATIAAIDTPGAATTRADWLAFWFFLVASPIIVWLVYSGRLRQAGRSLPIKPSAWPKWEMLASIIAFVAWAVALPDSPFEVFPWYNAALAGILVMITAAALGLITPIVHPVPPGPLEP